MQLILPEPQTAMDKRTKFLKIYANLPLNLRNEIILVLEAEPITWNVAYLEIMEETTRSKTILEKLLKLQII